MVIKGNPVKSRYEFYLDMSGTLKKSNDDIYVGCILMPDLYKSSFREKFYRQFPSLHSFHKKGSALLPLRLKEVIEYMDNDGVKMSCIVLKRHVIDTIRNQIIENFYKMKKIPKNKVNLRFFEEKTAASVYFAALIQYARVGYPYNCFSCPETQLDIQQLFVAINRISYSKKFHFRMASIPRRTEHMIKFADFIASAGRKLDKPFLENLKNFKFIEYKPDYSQLDRSFNISRHGKKSSYEGSTRIFQDDDLNQTSEMKIVETTLKGQNK